MTHKHILVVDDETNMRNTLAFILEAESYKVTTAEGGRKALQKILEAEEDDRPINLVITDVVMPDMDGLELIDEIRRLKPELPVLVITAYGSEKMKKELKRKGISGYLSKPFKGEELLARVAALLNE